MIYKSFKIKNFKGIDTINVNLSKGPNQNVYTFVGLNETGKTTILEAINFFRYNEETLDVLGASEYMIEDIHDLIPISKRDNFNDEILLEAELELDEDDEEIIRNKLYSKTKTKLSQENPIKTVVIQQSFKFKNSEYNKEESKSTYKFKAIGKKKKATKERDLGPEDRTVIIEQVDKLRPSILYFPNFLFDFPDKIYLEKIDVAKEEKKHSFYRKIIQDILDSLDNNLDLSTHITSRIRSEKKGSLESVTLKMGRKVTEVIFQEWHRIFNKQVSNKEIIIKADKEPYEDGDICFVEFLIKDTDGYYTVSDRSLGFRWFFSFLLLTQFRSKRKTTSNSVFFLFDEPASNLHSTAQKKLLESLEKLTSNCKIIYTTHSHHMINPHWLEGTFVVRNEGLNYEDDIEDFHAKKTDIKIYNYRSFVSKFPGQTSYFQPILDVLDYSPSNLENLPNIVIFEGKNDYYTLEYFKEIIFSKKKFKLNFAPAMGSGNIDSLISLYFAWGRNFLVVLDSDKEGEFQKQRYLDKFGKILEGKTFILSDIDNVFKKKKTETIFTDAERLKFQKTFYPDSDKFDKKKFFLSIQECLATKHVYEDFNVSTKDKFEKILNFLKNKMKDL